MDLDPNNPSAPVFATQPAAQPAPKRNEGEDVVHDLAALGTTSASDAGAFMQLEHPATGALLFDPAGRPYGITFAGPDSAKAKAAVRKSTDRRLSQNYGGRNVPLTSAALDSDAVNTLAAIALSWHVSVNGENPPCTVENVKAFLTSFPAWKEQSDRFTAARANFLKASPAT